MASVADQAPQEVHLLANNGQQARELQTFGASPSSQLAPPPAAYPPLETEADHDSRMRWRVVFISALIAVYVVISAVVRYLFDAVAMQEALEKVREVTHFQGGPSSTSLFLNSIPGVGMGITVGLLVPLCGYIGVQRSEKWLVGGFCCCNFCSCCTAIFGLVGLFLFSLGLQALAPEVELFLEKCDPMQCKANAFNGTDQAHLVDCLATGMWKEYRPHFPGPHYPAKCPPVFLTCDNFDLYKAHIADEDSAYDAMSDHSLPRMQPLARGSIGDADAPVRAAGMGDYGAFLASEVPAGRQYAPASQPSRPHQNLRRLRFAFGQLKQNHQRFFRKGHGDPTFQVPPMPKDPIKECTPAKMVEQFHQVRELVPVLLPQVQLYIFFRGVLLIPVMILGLLGFCWGKDYYSRLNDGYNPVGTNNVHTRPQVMLPPALGGNTPSTTQTQMAQPLMLNVPPRPQPQLGAILQPYSNVEDASHEASAPSQSTA